MKTVTDIVDELVRDMERRNRLIADRVAFRSFLLSEPPPLVPNPTHNPPDRTQ